MLHRLRSRQTAFMALLISILSVYAAWKGLFDKRLYADVVATGIFPTILIPGTFSQDLISLLSGIILALLSLWFLRQPALMIFVAILGLISYFLYAYGLFVITGAYTSLYLVYLVIWGLSIYSLIFGLASFDMEKVRSLSLASGPRIAIAVFLLVIVAGFVPLWLASLIPYTRTHLRPDFYGIFVMDLGVVMPALGIIAIMLLCRRHFAYILAGVALIKAFTLILSVAVGTAIAPLYELPIDWVMLSVYSAVVLLSLTLGAWYKSRLTMEEKPNV